MTITFERPTGAQADVMELEYISALHQTDLKELRLDASIKDEDIKYFLASRYGIHVTEEEVRSTILQGLGGSDGEDESIDIVELTAILFIPILLKAAFEVHGKQLPEGVIPAPEGMLDYVLKMILSDVTGSPRPKELTPRLMKKILRAYGENEIAENDELVSAMIKVAADEDSNGTLDVKSFTNALTFDVELYDIGDEARLSTFIQDVERHDGIGVDVDDAVEEAPANGDNANAAEGPSNVPGDSPAGDDSNRRKPIQGAKLKKKFAASEIDLTAETYRSQALLVCLWALTIVSFISYILPLMDGEISGSCTGANAFEYSDRWADNSDAIICSAIASLIRFLSVFIGIAGFGMAMGGIGSLGNRVGAKHWWSPLVASAFLAIVIFLFSDGSDPTYPEILSFFLVAVVIFLHLIHFLSMVCPVSLLERTGLFRLVSTSTIYAEREVKFALAHKLAKMVNNALDVMRHKNKDSVLDTHYGQALLAYAEHGSHCETTGGVYWAWRNFFNREIIHNEGIWFPARLITGSVSQAFLIPFILLQGFTFVRNVEENYDEEATRRALYNTVDLILDRAISDEGANNVSAQFSMAISEYASTFANQSNVDVNCSAFDILQTTQQWSTGMDVLGALCTSDLESLLPPSLGDLLPSSAGDVLNSTAFGDVLNSSSFEDVLNSSSVTMILNNASAAAAGINSSLADAGFNSSLASAAGEFMPSCNPELNSTLFCGLTQLPSGGLNPNQAFALLEGSGFDVASLEQVVREALQDGIDESVDDLYPSASYMVLFPLSMAVLVAAMTAAYTLMTYMPSVTSTILKLRSGVIPTLRDDNFVKYRRATDQVALLTGSLFWGTLASSIAVGFIVGLILFFFLWQATSGFVQQVVTILVGVIVIAVIRLSLIMTCRCSFYQAFYRKQPGKANATILALEWATFALSAGFVLLRMVKLVIAAAFSIGRIDTPFLAEGAGQIGPVDLDNYPTVHLKDVLSHEAHRHPYIELLGKIYLMKLRFSRDFGTTVGSHWRLIFVNALMPWLHQYRVLAREDDGRGLERQSTTLKFTDLRGSEVGKSTVLQSLRVSSLGARRTPSLSKSMRSDGEGEEGVVVATTSLLQGDVDLKTKAALQQEEIEHLNRAIEELLEENVLLKRDKAEQTQQSTCVVS